ncbi:MAG: helix-turn-helix domain-containing protein [Beijerinckiaceae bacterium]|nr:helix-turn-helix domain-containing protein [Beijerinckiaceae bacterium]
MFAVCSALEESEIHDLEAIMHHMTIAPKHTLFSQGDEAISLYTITSGTLRLHYDLPDGRRQIVGFAIPGDFLGLSLDPRFGITADALTEVSLCRFERARFMNLIERHPNMMRKMHEVASHELAIAQEHMVVLGRRRAEERVASFLLKWWHRLKRIQGASPTVPLPMGRQDIADHLGLTIETVSRTLARWMRERIILDVPDGVRILDAARLEELLGN